LEFQKEINKLEAERERITGVEPKATKTFEEQLRDIKQAYEDYENQRYILQAEGDDKGLEHLEFTFEQQKAIAADYISYLQRLWEDSNISEEQRKAIAAELRPYYEEKAKKVLDSQKAEMEALQRIVEENQKAFDQRAKQHQKYQDDRLKLIKEKKKLEAKLLTANDDEAEKLKIQILNIASAIEVLDTKIKFGTEEGIALYNDVSNLSKIHFVSKSQLYGVITLLQFKRPNASAMCGYCTESSCLTSSNSSLSM